MSDELATVPIEDMQAWNDTLASYAEDIREEVLVNTGLGIIGEAQITSPVDTGDLKASHFVDDYENEGVTIGAGGSGVDYAWAVHETHPTKAHWFREAIVGNFERIIEAALQLALRDRGIE